MGKNEMLRTIVPLLAVFLISIFGVRSEVYNPNVTTTTSKIENQTEPTTKTPKINDVDYWDNDDYVPYKTDRHDEFDWQLLKNIFAKEQSNVIFSPFSVKMILSILYEATGPDTYSKKELSTIFFNLNSSTIQNFYKTILGSLEQESCDYTINLATKMFMDVLIEPAQKFSAIAQSFYHTNFERLDFADSMKAAKTINDWCSNVTAGNLMNLVQPEQIQNSVLLLINAIYFKGLWRRPFNNATFENPFYLQPTKQVKVNYMSQKNTFYYFESKQLNAKLLRLPYKGKKFSMTIVLPSTKGGLDDTLSLLHGDKLRRTQWLMDETEVEVIMPKFKFDFTAHLKETLQSMGINEIFTEKASLPGLARGSGLRNQLKVSNIIQKAGLIVDEMGTTAYAATEVEITNKFGGNTVEEFLVNRPFAFFIEDESTGNLIFAGKVLDPTI